MESGVDDDDNQEEEVSVDSGDNQPSADVESQDLMCEVCYFDSTAIHDKRLCHAATGAFVVLVSLKIQEEGHGCPIWRAPITMILHLF